MIAYQIRLPSEGGRAIDFVAGDDAAARSFAHTHCRYSDCEIWDGGRLIHSRAGEVAPNLVATGLAPSK